MKDITTVSFTLALAALAGCGLKVPSPSLGAGTLPRATPAAAAVDDAARAPTDQGDGSGADRSTNHSVRWSRDLAAAEVDPQRGNCTPAAFATARQQGLVGPCWDPPGREEFAPPVHVVAGMRQLADDVYWFDIPDEARANRNAGCPELPGTHDAWFMYDPYSEDGGLPVPRIPRLLGKTVDRALAAVDALDVPLCVSIITWTTSCDAPVGQVCDQNFDPDYGHLNIIVRGADE